MGELAGGIGGADLEVAVSAQVVGEEPEAQLEGDSSPGGSRPAAIDVRCASIDAIIARMTDRGLVKTRSLMRWSRYSCGGGAPAQTTKVCWLMFPLSGESCTSTGCARRKRDDSRLAWTSGCSSLYLSARVTRLRTVFPRSGCCSAVWRRSSWLMCRIRRSV